MKHQFFSAFLILASGLFAACGGKDHAPSLSDSVVGPSGDASSEFGAGGHTGRQTLDGSVGISDGGDAAPNGGSSGGDGGSLAPIVSITYSPSIPDSSLGPVLISDSNRVTVVCNVARSSAPGAKGIDASSVTLEMLDASGMSLTMPPVPGVQSQMNPSQFSSDFIYTSVPNGKLGFRCTAKDLTGAVGSGSIGAYVDHGPKITLNSPLDKKAVPLKALAVDFNVQEAGLASNDDGAAVDTVTLAIGGQIISLKGTQDPKDATHYYTTVNLADGTIFPPNLSGSTSVVITASDKRGATRTSNSSIIVDSQPPVVSNITPASPHIIGGKTLITFTVSDDGSGVDNSSVTLTANLDVHPFDTTSGNWSVSMPDGTTGAETFTYVLYGTNVTGANVQILVNITATDLAGNKNAAGLSATYYLDTTPPIVDIDPPPVEEREKANDGYICSQPFRAVGKNSVKDRDTSAGFIQVRALCYDEGNQVQNTNQPVVYYSGIDHSSEAINPKIYIQGNAATGLLIDTNKDGICDDIATKVVTTDVTTGVTTEKDLPFGTLYPRDPEGGADYEPGPPIDTSIPDIEASTGKPICGQGGDSGPPTNLCNGDADLARIIAHDQVGGGTPDDIIYSLDSDHCGPNQLELSSIVTTNGWVCLAARATDITGNVGISAPIRVCLNDPTKPAPTCATNPNEPPPSCTQSCTAPPHFAWTPSSTHAYITKPN